ncbi:MAG: helicase, partial [Pirellula sp.]
MAELDIQSILGPGGKISHRIKKYEHRAEQLQMADAVAAALAKGQHLIVEAGTGVGKSFGYLVPAILHATASEESLPTDVDERTESSSEKDGKDDARVKRIIVSTHT